MQCEFSKEHVYWKFLVYCKIHGFCYNLYFQVKWKVCTENCNSKLSMKRGRGKCTLKGPILDSPFVFNGLNNGQFRSSFYILFYNFHSPLDQSWSTEATPQLLV